MRVFSPFKPFVSKSAVMRFLDTWCRCIFFSDICSRMWWCRTSICFVRSRKASTSAMLIELELSPYTLVLDAKSYFNSFMNCWIQGTSFTVDDRAMYSASVEDNATIAWRCDFQFIAAPQSFIANPVQERLLSTSDAQSASEYACKSHTSLSFL